MTACKTPMLVSLLAKSQELPASQVAIHVDSFHLVITDKWRAAAQLFPGRSTLPPSWCGHSYKSLYPFQPSCCILILREADQQSILQEIFLFYRCVVFVLQFLTSGDETWEKLTRHSSLELVPWLSCPALSQTQTAEWTTRVYGLWTLDLTALPAHPSTTFLPLPST
jgi:hypothetical protein